MLMRGLVRAAVPVRLGACRTSDAVRSESIFHSRASWSVRTFATDSASEVKELSAGTATEASKATVNPHAPIRKFFEEQTVGLGPSGMPLPVRTGRPWFARELRSKSFEDLHRLHFVLLAERNKLLNEKVRHRKTGRVFPSPERLQTVRRSMARLQTVLTERSWAARFERMADEMTSAAAVKAPEPQQMTEAEEKWRKARDQQRKPAKHRPRAVKASGGRKTKRKMAQAEQFARDTDKYIDELSVSRGRTDEPGKPRWRNLSSEARRLMLHKQKLGRSSKIARTKAQPEADKAKSG